MVAHDMLNQVPSTCEWEVHLGRERGQPYKQRRERHLHVGELPMLRVFFFFSSRRRHTISVSAFLLNRSSDLHARIRKTRYMHKMRCLLINRRSLLLALRLLWKTPIFPSNSRFPRLCAKCLLKLKRLVSILPMTKSKK